MAVTLLNVFIVPDGKDDEFFEEWRRTAAHFQKTKGFVECHFHKNTGIGNGTFKFINIATWESAEAWRIAHEDYPPPEYAIPGVKGHPAIFASVCDLYHEDA